MRLNLVENTVVAIYHILMDTFIISVCFLNKSPCNLVKQNCCLKLNNKAEVYTSTFD